VTVAGHPLPGWYCLAFDASLGVSSTSFIMAGPVPIAANGSFPTELRWTSSPTCAAGQLGVITYIDNACNAGDRAFQILVP
jgi:hypothetical protein